MSARQATFIEMPTKLFFTAQKPQKSKPLAPNLRIFQERKGTPMFLTLIDYHQQVSETRNLFQLLLP